MKRLFLLILCTGVISFSFAQTKFAGVLINQKFTDLVKTLNAKYTLIEPNYEEYKKEGYSTHVAHKYYINFLGTDNTKLIVSPNYKETDAVASIRIKPPYLCFLSLKDAKCEESLRHYLQDLKNTYENKYGLAVLEVIEDNFAKETIYKWDLGDVIISVKLYEPFVDILNRSAMTISVNYEVKYKHIKNKGENFTLDDI
ncbi:MAG: hypothetical protein J6S09_02150 [Paludibacteraceae bacterium]|nr:hypothetical protein [Paludibacteraceae bacterium]